MMGGVELVADQMYDNSKVGNHFLEESRRPITVHIP